MYLDPFFMRIIQPWLKFAKYVQDRPDSQL